MVPETYAKSRMSPQDGGREISAVKARASGLGVWMRRIATVIVVVCAPLSLALGPAEAASAHQSMAATGSQWAAQSPMPVISRGVPAYTNDSCAVASSANDSSYDTQWWTCATPSTGAPLYLAYDLSGVPVANRGQVLVLWFNDPQTMQYDYTYVEVHPCCTWKAFGIPSGYTLEANAAPGGTLPTSGWVALATVSGNALHSRQHSLNLSGYNWFRMNVTASVGSTKDYGVILNLDIHDASAGFQDDWIFYGDSITEGAMAHQSLSEFGGTGTWAQLINAARPSNFPAFEAGAIGGTLSADGVKSINGWLALFSGRYVGLAYGTNDAIWAVSPATFYDNYVTLVQAVLAAGKVPIVPKIAWGCTPEILANVPALNQKLDALYTAYPQIVRGPDLWSYFQANQSLISGDCIHPTGQGSFGMRKQWADAMLSRVYSPPTLQLSASTATPTAGQAFSMTVTAKNSDGTTATGYTGTVHFTSSDGSPGVVLPPDSTLANGQGTFSTTLIKAGSQTITARDTVTASITGSLTTSVRAAAASRLVLASTATPAAGTSFSFTVTAQDQFGNSDTGYAGTVHFTSSDSSSGVVLPADSTLTNGQGTFSATLTTAGSQSITGTDTVTASITGKLTVNVGPAGAASLILDAPSGAKAGQAFAVTVILKDQYGNVATGYRGTVHFATSDPLPTVVLPADYPFTAADAGTHPFSVTLWTPPSETISATDTANASLTQFRWVNISLS